MGISSLLAKDARKGIEPTKTPAVSTKSFVGDLGRPLANLGEPGKMVLKRLCVFRIIISFILKANTI